SRLVIHIICWFFFFQAEDGIRDRTVTGVQTCALPISPCWSIWSATAWPVELRSNLIYRRFTRLPGGCPGGGESRPRGEASLAGEIGRASRRERVEITVGAGS